MASLSVLLALVQFGCSDDSPDSGHPGTEGGASIGSGGAWSAGGGSASGGSTLAGAGGVVAGGGLGGSGGTISNGAQGGVIDPGAGGVPSGGGLVGAGGSRGGTGGAGGGGSGGSGVGTGGVGTGGAQECDLPTSFHWSSSAPLVTPKSPPGHDFVSIKDPTIVFYGGKYHVFSTVYDAAPSSKGWKSVYLNFTDFAQADAAPQSYMATWTTGSTVAPQVFFFRPHNKWYLIYQWGARYSTNNDINDPNGWSAPKQLLAGEPSGALDFWTICDDQNCHLFFSRDDGKLYRSKTSIANFPAFNGYETVMSDPQVGRLFEASNVYKIQGRNKYLLMVEAYGPRYFRSWTSSSLDGPWAPLADTQSNPYAGKANVTFQGQAWTDDISHGEMIRAGYDETLTLDACHLRFLFQGVDPKSGVSDYGLLPYRLGLLTATN